MNIFTDGEFAVSADDADALLRMVEEAHRPFVARPYPGDIAQEWARRWRQAQPRLSAEASVPARYATNAQLAVQALSVAYTGRGKQLPAPARREFAFEQAVAALVARWPGIALDQPERAWNARPEIAELHRLRAALHQQRELPASQSLHSGGLLSQAWG